MQKLSDRVLPDYTKGEEIFNMVSHIVGGAVGIAAIVLCVITAAIKGNVWGIVTGAVFGTSMVVLYCMSSIYHGLNKRLVAKKVFQIIDHCTIFILIAGTYTPISLCTLREADATLGWCIFGFVWAMAALGITLNAIDLHRFKVFSMICYLGMGWCIVLTWSKLVSLLGKGGVALLLAGGIAYTVGAVFFMFGNKCRYIHSVFHLFVVAGSILHLLCILFYVV